MMNLIFLGTGAGVPSKERNVSAIALTLLQELNQIWLFDCGEATQHQILHTTIKPRKVTKIFITHLHGDHIFGLPGFLSSRSFQGGEDQLTVYGPPGIREYIEVSLQISCSHLNYPLEVIEFDEGVLFENQLFKVHCKRLDHGIPSYGFRIEERDKPGELLVDKLKQNGIQPGPIYQKIKENPVVTLEDGRVINCSDFIGPSKKGRILSILGDTRNPLNHQSFINHSTVLVHEGTFSHEKQELAHQYYHSTVKEVATLAKEGNVGKLLLTHISSRYQLKDCPALLEEAQEVFPCSKIVRDFDQINID